MKFERCHVKQPGNKNNYFALDIVCSAFLTQVLSPLEYLQTDNLVPSD